MRRIRASFIPNRKRGIIMITKERLEELIEQGATIYQIRDNMIVDYQLCTYNYLEDNDLIYENVITNYFRRWIGKLENLFETKEDAEWELKMTATRTETLKLPSFNELQTKKEYYKNFALYFHLAIDMPYKKDVGAVIISQNDLKGNSYIIFDKPLTKENYIEACKLCLRLFKGE